MISDSLTCGELTPWPLLINGVEVLGDRIWTGVTVVSPETVRSYLYQAKCAPSLGFQHATNF